MIELKIKAIDYNRLITVHLLMLCILGQSGLPAGHGLIYVSGR
jgi:hypothetical protein